MCLSVKEKYFHNSLSKLNISSDFVKINIQKTVINSFIQHVLTLLDARDRNINKMFLFLEDEILMR